MKYVLGLDREGEVGHVHNVIMGDLHFDTQVVTYYISNVFHIREGGGHCHMERTNRT
jgi:hypothetical protein